MRRRLIIAGTFFVAGVVMVVLLGLPLITHIAEVQRMEKERVKTLEELFLGVECITLEDIEGITPSQYELPDHFTRVFMAKTVEIYKRGSFGWDLKNTAVYHEVGSPCFHTWTWDDPGPVGHSPP